MKNLILALSLSLTIGTILTLNSCKKTQTIEDDSVSAQDATAVNNAMNVTSDDATASAGQVQSFSGKTAGWWVALCGATTVDTGGHLITITYDGTSDCYGIIRSGSTSITLANGPWKDMGANISIAYNNLKVTDAVTGANFTLNGTHTVTNETGGLAWKIAFGLLTNADVKHRNQANMTITFPNGSQRTWAVDRTREWSSAVTGNQNTITASVYSEANGGVDVTGMNRFGNEFTNTILTPVAADNNILCLYKPYQGKIQQQVADRMTTVVFGTDSHGNPIGSPTTCGLGYFITYTNEDNGHTATKFVGYWF